MDEFLNPYIAGAPVKEPKMFFGREDVFQWIENSLSGRYVDHVLVIHGQRRVGKTSVLKQLPNRLNKHYLPVFFDLQGRSQVTLDRFLWGLAREIVKVANPELGINLAVPENVIFTKDPEFFENQFLPELRSQLGDRVLLITIDEFDVLEDVDLDAKDRWSTQIINLIRRLIGQDGIGFVFSIGSSGRKLENMKAAYTALFKTALYRKISFLNLEDTARLITEPVKGILEYQPGAIERIYQVTSGHPYFTQLICYELFAHFQKSGQKTISEQDVNTILEDVVERGTVNLKFIWDEATPLEKWILAFIATSPGKVTVQSLIDQFQGQSISYSRETLNAALLHLQEKEVLSEENTLRIYLMHIWLKKNRPLERVREEFFEQQQAVSQLIRKGDDYLQLGNDNKAIDIFRKVLASDPDNSHALTSIASCYYKQSNFDQAIHEYEKALIIDPQNADILKDYFRALLFLSDNLAKQGNYLLAISHYNKILSLDPENDASKNGVILAVQSLIDTAIKEGRVENARNILEEQIKQFPGDPTLLSLQSKLRKKKRITHKIPVWTIVLLFFALIGLSALGIFLIRGGNLKTPLLYSSSTSSANLTKNQTPTEYLQSTNTLQPSATILASLTPTFIEPTATQVIINSGYQYPSEMISLANSDRFNQLAKWEIVTPTCLSISNDNSKIAVGTPIGIYIYDLTTIQVHFINTSAGVSSIALSPNGQTLAVGLGDSRLELWRIDNFSLIHTFSGHQDNVTSVSFNQKGDLLASGSLDGTVRMWQISDYSLLYTLKGYSGRTIIAFSPDGTLLASGSDTGIQLWQAATGSLVRKLNNTTVGINRLSFSLDGKVLAIALQNGTVQLWDPIQGKLMRALQKDSDAITNIDFSPDSQLLASSSDDKTIQVWRVSDGSAYATLIGHQGSVLDVKFSADGQTLYSVGDDGTIRTWGVEGGSLLFTLDLLASSIRAVAVSPDGQTIASSSWEGVIRLWNLRSGQLSQTLEEHTENICCLAFSPDGQWLASGSDDLNVRLWQVKTGTLEQIFSGHNSKIESVTFSADGKMVASGDSGGTIKLWDVANHTLVETLSGQTASVDDIAFAPDGSYLASASLDGTINLWQMPDGKLLTTLKGDSIKKVFSLDISPDGSMIAAGTDGDTLVLWRVADGAIINTITSPIGQIWSLKFDPSGEMLFVSMGNSIGLFRVSDGKLMQRLDGDTGSVYKLALTPDEKVLVSSSQDGTIRIWGITP